MSMYPKNPKDDILATRTMYALFDPRPRGRSIYIGTTTNYKQRYNQHKKGGTGAKGKWLSTLAQQGLKPSFIILEKELLYAFEAFQLETVWLRVAIRQQGAYHLVNNDFDIQRAWKAFDSLKKKPKKECYLSMC
jgi:hypothetical protein